MKMISMTIDAISIPFIISGLIWLILFIIMSDLLRAVIKSISSIKYGSVCVVHSMMIF